MKWAILAIVIAVASLALILPSHSDDAEPGVQSQAHFRENVGQHPDEVAFVAHAGGRAFFVTDDGFVLSKVEGDAVQHAKITFLGAQTNAITGLQPTGSEIMYWKGDVRGSSLDYTSLKMHGVYPGIDVMVYGNDENVEFDFIVAPGANPDLIQLHAPRATLQDGLLVLPGEMKINAPVTYQANGRSVASAYQLSDEVVTFALGTYDPGQTLTIDPIIDQISFWGGSQEDEIIELIRLDDGNLMFAGNTNSIDFPLSPDAFEEEKLDLDWDVFITKMTPDRHIIFSAFIGGQEEDLLEDIFIDGDGNTYLTGSTRSDNFPIRDAIQIQRASTNSNTDAFITRISPEFETIDFSTYFGGGAAKAGLFHHDVGTGIVADSGGFMYVMGHTFAADFPITADAMQPNFGRSEDLFMLKLHPNGGLITSTYIFGDMQNEPGGGKEYGLQLELIDGVLWGMAQGNIVDLPTSADAVQPTYIPGGAKGQNGIIFSMDTDLEALGYVTYVGGSGDDELSQFIMREGNLWVVGSSTSKDLFTHPAAYFNKPPSDAWNAFILTWTPSDTSYELGTYYGGSERAAFHPAPKSRPANFDHPLPSPFGNADTAPADNRGYGIAFDPRGNVALVGSTDAYEMWNNVGWNQRGLPLLRPFDDSNIRFQGDVDGFIAVLTPELDDIHLSSYLGGTVLEEGTGTHGIDSLRNILITEDYEYIIAGLTNSHLNLPFTDNPLDYTEVPDSRGQPERIGWSVSQYFDNPYGWVGIGAPGNDVMGVDAGAVYTYDINVPFPPNPVPPNIWRQHDFITLPELEAGDQFGYGIALGDIGSWDPGKGCCDYRAKMIVGAPGDDDGAVNAGAAYIFWHASDPTQDTWLLPDPNAYPLGDEAPYQKFVASDAQADAGFGAVIANTVDYFAIAAPYHDVTVAGGIVQDAGAVYLYQYNPVTLMMDETFIITSPQPVENGRFGSSLNFAQSFQNLAVGEPGGVGVGLNTGAVHLFQTTAMNIAPALAQTITDPNGEYGDAFGQTVRYHSSALDTTLRRLAVGAPHDDLFGRSSGAVFVFDQTDSGIMVFTQEIHQSYAEEGDIFGWYVDFDARASELYIGAPGDKDDGDNSGAVYFFDNGGDAAPWDQRNKMKAAFPEAGDGFGHTFNFWDYGVITMPGSDRTGSNRGAVLLNNNQHHPFPTPPADDRAWSWGAPGNIAWYNEAYLLAPEHQPDKDIDDTVAHMNGFAVAIDDNIAVSGAPQQDTTIDVDDSPIPTGAAYAIRRNGNLWGEQDTLYASDAGNGDRFGHSVDASGDRIVVGAPLNADAGTGSGSAYVFEWNYLTRDWDEVAKLVASDAAVEDNFGWSVSIHGDRIAVGAPGQLSNANGQAYVFDYIDGDWVETAILVPDDPDVGLEFGAAVAVWDETVFVGAPGDILDEDDVAGGPGGIYIFQEFPLGWLQEANPVFPGRFGHSIDIWDDKAIVGAPGASAVYFYVLDGTWQFDDTLVVAAPDNLIGQAGDRAGWDVAIHETTAIAGAPLFDTTIINPGDCTDCGSAAIMGREWGAWTIKVAPGFVQSTRPSLADAEQFGAAIALSDNTAFFGAPNRAIDVGADAGVVTITTAIGFWSVEYWEFQEDPNARRGSIDIYFARMKFIPPFVDFSAAQSPIAIDPEAAVEFPCANSPVQFTDLSRSSASLAHDGKPFEFFWDFGDGTTSVLRNPIHSYANLGSYLVTLDVTFQDGVHPGADIRVVTKTVNVVANQPAIVTANHAGDVNEHQTAQLLGTIVDPEGRAVTYEWVQVSGPQVELQALESLLNPTFTAPDVPVGGAVATFELRVFDGCEWVIETTSINILHVNKPPVANAGGDRVGAPNSLMFMDGSASSDPDGDMLTFYWEQTQGVSVDLYDDRTATPNFYAPVSATNNVLTLKFKLTVDDGLATDEQIMTVTVSNDGKEGQQPSQSGSGGVSSGGGGSSQYYDQTCTLYPSLCQTIVNCQETPAHVDCQEPEETEGEGEVTEEPQTEMDPDELNKVVVVAPSKAKEPNVPWLAMFLVLGFAVLLTVGIVVIRKLVQK